MLHSLALNSGMWASIVAEFTSDFEVIVVDARGHGASTWDEQSFSVIDLADDLLALINHLNLDQIHLLGLSMGGSTALTFAGLYPSRVSRLALCDTTAWYGPGAVEAWLQRAQAAISTPRSEQIPSQLDRWFTQGFLADHPEIANEIAELFVSTSSPVHAAACYALGALDSRQLLTNITAPTFVLAGEQDKATPVEMGEQIAETVPDATLQVVDGGHFAILESNVGRANIRKHLAAKRHQG